MNQTSIRFIKNYHQAGSPSLDKPHIVLNGHVAPIIKRKGWRRKKWYYIGQGTYMSFFLWNILALTLRGEKFDTVINRLQGYADIYTTMEKVLEDSLGVNLHTSIDEQMFLTTLMNMNDIKVLVELFGDEYGCMYKPVI